MADRMRISGRGKSLSPRGWYRQLRRACYLTMSQTPAATTAARVTDIASGSAMTFAHSQIDTVQFQPAPLPHCTVHELETRR